MGLSPAYVKSRSKYFGVDENGMVPPPEMMPPQGQMLAQNMPPPLQHDFSDMEDPNAPQEDVSDEMEPTYAVDDTDNDVIEAQEVDLGEQDPEIQEVPGGQPPPQPPVLPENEDETIEENFEKFDPEHSSEGYQDFIDNMKGRFQERLMRSKGLQAAQPTLQDVEDVRKSSLSRATLGGLSDAMQQMSNVGGKWEKSPLKDSFAQMDKADQSALNQRMDLYKTGTAEEDRAIKQRQGFQEEEKKEIRFKYDQEKRDPESASSNAMRSSIQAILGDQFKLPPNMSAEQLEKMFPQLAAQILESRRFTQQMEMENLKHGHDMEKFGVQSAKADKKEVGTTETGLRKEFDTLPEVKDFRVVKNAYQNLQKLGAKPAPTAADDMSIVFSFMKLMDPASTVREGEYAQASQTRGIPDHIVSAYNKAQSGQILTPEQRKNFVTSARGYYETSQNAVSSLANKYKGLAKQSGAKPENVVVIDVGEGPKKKAKSGPVRAEDLP